MSEPRKTPLYQKHINAGAKMIDFGGWMMPVQYTGILDEHSIVRTDVGIFDASHMGEIFVTGPEAGVFLNSLATNDIRKLADGGIHYTSMCRPDGGILDDLLIYRMAPDRFMVCSNASNYAKIAAWMHKNNNCNCVVEDKSDAYSLIPLQGPRAENIAAAIFGDAVRKIKYYGFAEMDYSGVVCIVSRTGYTGEDGYEFFIPNEAAPKLWDELAGRHSCRPIGLGARDTLRLEMGYALYGNDIDETTNPIEAGLGWIVKLDKGDFMGRKPIEEMKKAGPPRKLVGLEITGKGVARHEYPIVKNGKTIGKVTSGTMSPSLKKAVAMGYVATEFAKIGETVEVEVRGKGIGASVARFPFVESHVKK